MFLLGIIITSNTLLILFFIHLNTKKVMAKQQEVAAELVALKAQVEKIKTEVTAKLAALADAIANQGNASPEVESALAELKASVQGVDDLNEDAPVEEPTTPE